MKFIPVPPPVLICDIEGNAWQSSKGETETVNFARFVLGRLTDPKFSSNMAMVLAAVEIRERVKAIKDGWLELESEHYETLKGLVQNPSPPTATSQGAGYPPGLSHNLVSFMKAIVNDAVDKKPEPKVEAKADNGAAGAEA